MVLQPMTSCLQSEGTVQMGGSDQWGNYAGAELTRRVGDAKVYGLTHAARDERERREIGKSVDGAVWLDAQRTSPFKFYQLRLNQSDADALRYIKYFTLCTPEEFEALEEKHQRPLA